MNPSSYVIPIERARPRSNINYLLTAPDLGFQIIVNFLVLGIPSKETVVFKPVATERK